MIKKLPNIICWFRITLIPFILVFLLDNPINEGMTVKMRFLIGGIIFAVAIFSDMVDGKIARKFDAITNFGKFLDPLADKMLVLSVLTAFVELDVVSSVPVLIILAREFLVTGLRLGAAGKGNVVAANYWGKIKTTLQGMAIGLTFIYVAFVPGEMDVISGQSVANLFVPQLFLWLTAAYTAVSAIPYYISMKEYIKD